MFENKGKILKLFIVMVIPLIGVYFFFNSSVLFGEADNIIIFWFEAMLFVYCFSEFGAKITISIILFYLFVFIGLFILAIMLMFSTDKGYDAVLFSLIYLQIMFFVFCLIWKRDFLKKFKLIILGVFLVSCIIVAINSYYDIQDRKIPVLYEVRDNLADYTPFAEGSKVVKLDKESNLKFTDDLPRLDTATGLYPIVAAFVEATYPRGNYQLGKQDILTQTTTRKAYNRLIDGEVDMIFALAPSKEQLEYAKQRGVELDLVPFGRDAFVFFVNAQNNVDDLTVEEIRGIYSGKITNWRQVGGANEKIKAFQRPINSGSQSALIRLMGTMPLMEAPSQNVMQGMGGIISETADYKNYRYAIGYSFRYYATKMVINNDIKLLKINGVMPSADNIKSGDYPILEQFYVVTNKENNNQNIKKFADWIISSQGQELVDKAGYVGNY